MSTWQKTVKGAGHRQIGQARYTVLVSKWNRSLILTLVHYSKYTERSSSRQKAAATESPQSQACLGHALTSGDVKKYTHSATCKVSFKTSSNKTQKYYNQSKMNLPSDCPPGRARFPKVGIQIDWKIRFKLIYA